MMTRHLVKAVALRLCMGLFFLAQPLLIERIITTLYHRETLFDMPIVILGLMATTFVGITVWNSPSWPTPQFPLLTNYRQVTKALYTWHMHAAMVKLRAVLVTTIYHKMFTLEQWQLTDAAAVTLMTNDADAAQNAVPYLVKLMAAVPDLACGMGLLYYLIGNVAFYSMVPALCESFVILPQALVS